ncbi:MAG: beta-galactosidase [Bryobacteraceae bacterium]|jgi:hypothetical protein
MHRCLAALFFLGIGASSAFARVAVFEQPGFPTVASQPVSHEVLLKALDGYSPVFLDADALKDPAALHDVDLLVLPYGSAFPADAWTAIHAYLKAGGNLLVIGGQPFRVPVNRDNGNFVQEPRQDTYSRELGFPHSYEIPRLDASTKFNWRDGYSFLTAPQIRALRFFAVEGRIDGLGYMADSSGDDVAAAVIVSDRNGGRMVMLDFEPEPDYWDSADGTLLIREAAEYARHGVTSFWIETLFSTLKPGEFPEVVVHLQHHGHSMNGEARIELLSGTTVLDSARVVCSGSRVDAGVDFHKPLTPGFYTIRGVFSEDGQPREFTQNGFWVEDSALLNSGPVLGVRGDFLTRDGKPWFPVGANYFTTENHDWDFSGPRNARVWDRDFADMARHGVTIVRTGVWMPRKRFVEPSTSQVNERFLRNLEAFLLSARRHNIAVNFTFFAFAPQIGGRENDETGPNPYLDPGAVYAEKTYVESVVDRFKDAPWLCWDLINEPSFSNPRRLWKGNTPNGDAAELAQWRAWLEKKYTDIRRLAAAWRVTPDELGAFDSVPLPDIADLALNRYDNTKEVRAVDYNLFAQDMFTQWVHSMVTAIRSTGSRQLIDVGQDEGGVADRVLNQFYGGAGVSFTTNHTYWRDDALLWDSIAAKRPGVPNISGETGYQPVWAPDGAWRYDEVTGEPLLERKWALGFAAANSGVLPWDWDREVDFGLKRSDGSAKTLENVLRDIGGFAEHAAPLATGLIQPQIAIILPQSFQLSVFNAYALEAQQQAVRALYQYARLDAYAVGEYQTELLGDPKLIILPCPYTLDESAWRAILSKVEAGATLLVSGRFDEDSHFHATGRQSKIGLDYEAGPLTIRENVVKWPDGEARLTYSGEKTTYPDRASLPNGATWTEKQLGKGRILFEPLPLELNDNVQAIGDIYRYAAKTAGVVPDYSTDLRDPGILICPTRFPHATLYVLTSESGRAEASFRDAASGKVITGQVQPGHAALLLIGEDGAILASWKWDLVPHVR